MEMSEKKMIDAGKFIDDLCFGGKSPLAGDYVKSKRKILGLTLNELSMITGIDEANLSSYENNKKEIGLKTAVKLGAALSLRPSILIECSMKEAVSASEVKEILNRAKKILREKSK